MLLFFIVLSDLQATHEFGDIRWQLLQIKVKEDRIKRVFDLLRSHEIEPVLIKGWAASLNYPTDVPRVYDDTDIAVADSDYRIAREVCNSEEASGLIIDLHRELRHMSSRPWDDLFRNSRLISIDDTAIRILRPEDHLQVLCVHWLTDGGAHKLRLWDIYYAVANRPADFDWERCLETIPENRRRWIITTIGIANVYLGLNIDDLPFQEEAKSVPRWIKECIESEWKSDVRLEPVIMHLRSPSSLLKQVLKRIPPNPIRSTIEMEGRIEARTRIFYQIGTLVKMLTHPFGPRPLLDRIKRRWNA